MSIFTTENYWSSMLRLSALLAIAFVPVKAYVHTMADKCPHYCRCMVTNNLTHVECIGYNLTTVELDIPRTVQWLDLSHNSISELKDYKFQQSGFKRIIKLNVDHNRISSIGNKTFHGMDFINYIDLSNNYIFRIDPVTFENNPTLEHLVLSNNPLKIIFPQRPFLISNSLKILEISRCSFTFFLPITFNYLPHLGSLDISSNDITLLSDTVLKSLENLHVIDITMTAIKCDTISSNFFEWATIKFTRIIGSPCSKNTNKYNNIKQGSNNRLKIKKNEEKKLLSFADTQIEFYVVNHGDRVKQNSVKVTTESTLLTTKKTSNSAGSWSHLFFGILIGSASTATLIALCALCFNDYCRNSNVVQNTYEEVPNTRQAPPPEVPSPRQTPPPEVPSPRQTPPPPYSEICQSLPI